MLLTPISQTQKKGAKNETSRTQRQAFDANNNHYRVDTYDTTSNRIHHRMGLAYSIHLPIIHGTQFRV